MRRCRQPRPPDRRVGDHAVPGCRVGEDHALRPRHLERAMQNLHRGVRQRHDAILLDLGVRASGDRLGPRLEVDLRPRRPAHLAQPLRRQRREPDRQLDRRRAARGVELRKFAGKLRSGQEPRMRGWRHVGGPARAGLGSPSDVASGRFPTRCGNGIRVCPYPPTPSLDSICCARRPTSKD